MRLIVLVTAALLFSLVSLEFFSAPYAWICLSWLLVCIYLVKHGKHVFTRVTAVNVGAVLFVLGAFEGYLYIQAGEPYRDEARNQAGKKISRYAKHDVLGWGPSKSRVVSWKRYYGDALVFDVVYRIDSNGLRVSPEKPGRQTSECILFFGGSFTFGAGLNDDQTMPYLVASRHLDTYRVLNFGYSGYGAHQMLAAIEHGIVDDTIDCQPEYVIYLGIADHVRRAVDKVNWNMGGPQYLPGAGGEVIYSGQFDDTGQSEDHRFLANSMKALAGKSFIIRMLKKRSRYISSLTGDVNDDDIALYTSILDNSRKLIEQRYPGSEFHLLIWNNESWISEAVVAGLEEKGLRVHFVSEMLPDFFTDRSKYVLSREDGHPNQLANGAIADYVSKTIVRQ